MSNPPVISPETKKVALKCATVLKYIMAYEYFVHLYKFRALNIANFTI